MRCPYCGNVLSDYESECHFCGQPLEFSYQPDARDRITRRELHNWRATEKPPSGAAVRHVPKARREATKMREELARAQQAARLANEPPALDPADVADPAKPPRRTGRERIAELIEPGRPGELSAMIGGSKGAATSSKPQSGANGKNASQKHRDPSTAPKSAKQLKKRARKNAERPPKQKVISIELPPVLRTMLLGLLCVALLCGAGYGVMRFTNANRQTDASIPAPTADILTAGSIATESPENAPPTARPATAQLSLDGAATESPTEAATPAPTEEPVFVADGVTVNAMEVDGDAMHELRFTAPDGQIFIEQMNRSYPVVNGECVIDIPDSTWFYTTPQADELDVEIVPVLTRISGEVRVLDAINYTVSAPESPIAVVSPEGGYAEVLVSLYNVQVKVQPGSTVSVDGEDVSDLVGKSGLLSVNTVVKPIGVNLVTFTVTTPNHKTTQRVITIYRPIFDIPLELDINAAESTQSSSIALSGTFEPGATLTVEPQCGDDSVVDQANGTFRFTFKLSRIGDNEIKITASMPGKEDSVITHDVYYMPTLEAYTQAAWKMDYQGIVDYNKSWIGRVFLCNGTVSEIINVSPQQSFIMLVGGDRSKPIFIDNFSTTEVVVGSEYRIYADLVGMYDASTPSLNGRFTFDD